MRWQALAFPIVLLMDIIIVLNFIQWQRDSVYDIQQRQLDLQVNYATDAAAQDLLGLGIHIDTDYADWGNMKVEPELAYDTYMAVLLRNFGWGDDARNREALEDYIPFFIVAAYDGYYIRMIQPDNMVTQIQTSSGPRDIDNPVYSHIWSPKIPYAEYVNNRYVFYNLGETKYGTITAGTVKADNDFFGSSVTTVERKKACIADTLQEACNSAMYMGLNGEARESWSIPAQFSQWSENNPIEKVSILTYILDPWNKNSINISAFGISGAKIDEPDYCITYLRDGVKCYTYIENKLKLEQEHNSGTAVIEFNSVVQSPKDAAEQGYYYDIKFITGG